MRDFDCPSPVSQPLDSPNPGVDSTQHLDHIRDELRNDNLEPTRFYGVDLGIVKLGFTSDGAFNPGINLGFVEAQGKVGLVNGVEAGLNLGPIVQAGAGAYAGFDQNGIFGQAKAGGEALTLVGATAHTDARFGNATGVDGGAAAHVGPIEGRAGTGVALGQDGLDATASGHARIGGLANAHGGAHIGLNHDTQIGAAVGAGLGDASATAGAGIFSDGNATVRPDLYLQGRAGQDYGSAHLIPPGGYTNSEQFAPEATMAPPAPPRADCAQNITATAAEESNSAIRSAATSLEPAQAMPVQPQGEIEVRPLPKPATPENMERMDHIFRTVNCRVATYDVHKGDTYESIARKLMPGADDINILVEAKKLQQLHEASGFHSLKAGQHIATESPQEIDQKTRVQVARYFDLPIPQY